MEKQIFAIVLLLITTIYGDMGDFRPPAVPLIVFSPHVSVWSASNKLTDSDTIHWSGSELNFHGLIEVDQSISYRFLGIHPIDVPSLVQNRVIVEPWRTIYTFSTPKSTIELVVTFIQPISISKPFTYITFDVRSLDGKNHSARIYFEQGPLICVNQKDELVYWNRSDTNLTILTMNANDQTPFRVRGDTTRNNWGYAHLISENSGQTTGYQGFGYDLRQAFVNRKAMPSDDTRKPRRANDQPPSSAFIINLYQIGKIRQTSYIIFFYDDVYSMSYFEEWQVPLWRFENNDNLALFINQAYQNYQSEVDNINKSTKLLGDLLNRIGGPHYSTLCSLVTRQITGAITTTWSDRYNRSQIYMKEISSDGDVNTVDVIFPSSPFFLLLYPQMLRDLLLPLFDYANNATKISYNLAWAPHHLGTWPVCDILPSKQEQMPMEESANMLLMCAALVQRLNTTDFLQPYWKLINIWADYLNSTLPDPKDQLCTDDFEGPSPHNCNLALKGILGLGAYALLLNATGQTQKSTAYMIQAQNYADYWMKTARDDNHYRRQYNLPNSWSQKYNLIYQSILSLNLFSNDVSQAESKFYLTKLASYGIPLDSRLKVAKADWTSWIALLNNDPTERDLIFEKLFKFANESLVRVPFSDFYEVDTGFALHFRARPVMGAIFIRALLAN